MAGTHSLQHEIFIVADPARIEVALTTADGLRGWNTPLVDGNGEPGTEWVLRYPGRPEFAWRIDSSNAEEILWTCTKGPGDSVGTTAHFTFVPAADGRTRVRITHGGWPHDKANFIKCNTIWGALMYHLRNHVESGAAEPAFS